MSDIVAVALFCEDIREEVGGSTSVIGVMRDNLELPVFPNALPKLGIYIRINLPLDVDIHTAQIRFTTPNGESSIVGEVSSMEVEEAIRLAAADGAPSAGLLVSIVASPYRVMKPGRFVVELEYGDLKRLAGWLNFRENPKAPSL